jgi:hypothetical protein
MRFGDAGSDLGMRFGDAGSTADTCLETLEPCAFGTAIEPIPGLKFSD